RVMRSLAEGREDSYMAVYTYDSPERFVAGTVGQPGQRTFYLQASSAGRTTSVVVGKFQVSLLSHPTHHLPHQALPRSPRPGRGGGGAAPAAARCAVPEHPRRALPLTGDFRGGAMAHGWDGEDEQVVIEAQEEPDTPIEPLAEEVPEDGPGVLRVRLTPAAARAFSKRAIQIVGQGRPPCPLCGLPLDEDGHICPRQNGHRVSNA